MGQAESVIMGLGGGPLSNIRHKGISYRNDAHGLSVLQGREAITAGSV